MSNGSMTTTTRSTRIPLYLNAEEVAALGVLIDRLRRSTGIPVDRNQAIRWALQQAAKEGPK